MIRRKTNKFESRKLTLEERINRLERALTSNRKSRKFESKEFGVFTADEARRFMNMLNRRSDISVAESSVSPNTDTWFVVIADEDGDNETSFDIYKLDDHVEAWMDGRSRYAQVFSSVEECADEILPYDTGLWGDEFY